MRKWIWRLIIYGILLWKGCSTEDAKGDKCAVCWLVALLLFGENHRDLPRENQCKMCLKLVAQQKKKRKEKRR